PPRGPDTAPPATRGRALNLAPLSCARPCLLRRAQRGDALIMLGQGITSFRPAGRVRSCRGGGAHATFLATENGLPASEAGRPPRLREHPRAGLHDSSSRRDCSRGATAAEAPP